ncbi:MAG: NAD(P)H-hydrate dehydratase [Sneathiella sp.]
MDVPKYVLTTSQMYAADKLAVKGGVSGLELMENAGRAVADEIMDNFDRSLVFVVCGPGNNGGDGYVVARHLANEGWPVTVAAYGDPSDLPGDAAVMHGQCQLDVISVEDLDFYEDGIVVDAVFGAGFRGELPAEIKAVFKRAVDAGLDCVAVDIPSGVNGDTGDVVDGTPRAKITVSFHTAKVGHLFYPARSHIGDLKIKDIGIPENIVDDLKVTLYQNSPDLWFGALPILNPVGHKYDRGHAAVVGGGVSSSGAARIAARAALRAGAGAVTAVCPPSALTVYAGALEAVMVKSIKDDEAFPVWLKDKRIGAVLIGPGNGTGNRTRAFVTAALQSEAHVVLDADALTEFQSDPETLFSLISQKTQGKVVLTPHEAEFTRLFDLEGSALDRAKQAAKISQATIILKGATTVIADPTGTAFLSVCAPPWLATAGSGDALAGIVLALLLGPGDAARQAAAAVWIHSKAANSFGRGLIAEDIEKQIPNILQELAENFR